jgi:hypothetical protein
MANEFIPLISPSTYTPIVSRIGAVLKKGLAEEQPFTAVAPRPSAAAPTSPTLPAPALSCARPGTVEPELTLKREGDRVTQIHIRCSCGESIVLDCNQIAPMKGM